MFLSFAFISALSLNAFEAFRGLEAWIAALAWYTHADGSYREKIKTDSSGESCVCLSFPEGIIGETSGMLVAAVAVASHDERRTCIKSCIAAHSREKACDPDHFKVSTTGKKGQNSESGP